MMLTNLCENSKVVSSDFSMMKNVVTTSSFSSSSIKIFIKVVLNQDFLIQFVCLKLLQSVCNVSKSIHHSINYQLCYHYFLLISMIFCVLLICFLLAHQRKFFHQPIHWSLLFQHLVYSTLRKMFYLLHL